MIQYKYPVFILARAEILSPNRKDLQKVVLRLVSATINTQYLLVHYNCLLQLCLTPKGNP